MKPSKEASTTWLYSGNTVNCYAQSFVAATATIGEVKVYLKHYNDATSGALSPWASARP